MSAANRGPSGLSSGKNDYEVERTADGARVVVDGVVRATFVGDLDDPTDQAAFDEMVAELFKSGSKPEVPPH